MGTANGQLLACPDTPNCVSSQAKDEEHFIQPLRFTGTLQQAQTRLLDVLKALKGTELVEKQPGYIRAAATSRVFRFVDDVEFYFPDAKGEEITIQVRSASRIGKSDFGVNRKRIEQIRQALTPGS